MFMYMTAICRPSCCRLAVVVHTERLHLSWVPKSSVGDLSNRPNYVCLFWTYLTRGLIRHLSQPLKRPSTIIYIFFFRKSQCFPLHVECWLRELLIPFLSSLVWRGLDRGLSITSKVERRVILGGNIIY